MNRLVLGEMIKPIYKPVDPSCGGWCNFALLRNSDGVMPR